MPDTVLESSVHVIGIPSRPYCLHYDVYCVVRNEHSTMQSQYLKPVKLVGHRGSNRPNALPVSPSIIYITMWAAW